MVDQERFRQPLALRYLFGQVSKDFNIRPGVREDKVGVPSAVVYDIGGDHSQVRLQRVFLVSLSFKSRNPVAMNPVFDFFLVPFVRDDGYFVRFIRVHEPLPDGVIADSSGEGSESHGLLGRCL